MVPEPIRRLWAYQKDSDVNILEVEANGLLILLENWVDILQHYLWVHYIDNNDALAALIKGSSSVLQADLIVGETWANVARQRSCLGSTEWIPDQSSGWHLKAGALFAVAVSPGQVP